MGPAYIQYCMNKKKFFKKICSRWIPRNLSITHGDWPKEMLQEYNRGASKHVYDIVTGDELGIYTYEPESLSTVDCMGVSR